MFSSLAQNNESIKKVNYCGKNFKVPSECLANSKYELTCNDFTIQWLYMNEQLLEYMSQQLISQLEQKLTIVEKKPIKCISLNKKMKGSLLTYLDEDKEKYRIIAYGKVKSQYVIVNLGLTSKPTNNEKLPEFVKQIIQFEE